MQGPGHEPTVGLWVWGYDDADYYLWQCDGPMGQHNGVRFVGRDRGADHQLIVTLPVDRKNNPNVTYWQKRRLKLKGRKHYRRVKTALRFEHLGRDPKDITLLVYEPDCAFGDEWYEAAHEQCGTVYGADPRCDHQIRLPVTWSFPESAPALGAESPPIESSRWMKLCCISSGVRTYPGHHDRLDFIAKLRSSGIPFELFGRGLDQSLRPSGSVYSKGMPLRASEFTLVIENDAAGAHYVSEKLWDPLLCWSLPLYYGSTAADEMIPGDSFIRLPDLGDGAIETIREAVSRPGLWRERLDAIAEARRKILGEHNLMNWAQRVMPL